MQPSAEVPDPLWNPGMIVPVGTKVVLRAAGSSNDPAAFAHGAVAVVVGSPADATHAYRVRLVTGAEQSIRRGDFRVLRAMQRGDLDAPAGAAADNPLDWVIYRCVVGSRAFGLDTPESDTDRRGIYLPPADVHWSIFGVPEQIELDESQECYWELGKFVSLALKANPNVLECLYSPLVETATPLARELIAIRELFLSRLIYQTYNGYVLSQFRKLEQDLRTRGELRWKHAMHLIRLLLSGIVALREGHVPVRVENHRDELLAIRAGRMPWPDIEKWRLSLHGDFDAALAATRLPDRPNYARINAFVIAARRFAVSDSFASDSARISATKDDA